MDLHVEHDGLLAIKGVFNGLDKRKFLDFSKGMGLPFPLYEDAEGSFRTQMRVPPNSVTKILTGPSGTVLFSDSNQESPKDQRYFISRVAQHISSWSR